MNQPLPAQTYTLFESSCLHLTHTRSRCRNISCANKQEVSTFPQTYEVLKKEIYKEVMLDITCMLY